MFIRFKDVILNIDSIVSVEKKTMQHNVNNKQFESYNLILTTSSGKFRGIYSTIEDLNAAFDHLETQLKAESFHIEKGFGKFE